MQYVIRLGQVSVNTTTLIYEQHHITHHHVTSRPMTTKDSIICQW